MYAQANHNQFICLKALFHKFYWSILEYLDPFLIYEMTMHRKRIKNTPTWRERELHSSFKTKNYELDQDNGIILI